MLTFKEFDWKKIPGKPATPIEYVLRAGELGHKHEFKFVASIPKYDGRCRVCDCGRIETCPAPGELAQFRDMPGEYLVQADGSPGLGIQV